MISSLNSEIIEGNILSAQYRLYFNLKIGRQEKLSSFVTKTFDCFHNQKNMSEFLTKTESFSTVSSGPS